MLLAAPALAHLMLNSAYGGLANTSISEDEDFECKIAEKSECRTY